MENDANLKVLLENDRGFRTTVPELVGNDRVFFLTIPRQILTQEFTDPAIYIT